VTEKQKPLYSFNTRQVTIRCFLTFDPGFSQDVDKFTNDILNNFIIK
jgi:hypothetical protein